jgi:hypothetical protein
MGMDGRLWLFVGTMAGCDRGRDVTRAEPGIGLSVKAATHVFVAHFPRREIQSVLLQLMAPALIAIAENHPL